MYVCVQVYIIAFENSICEIFRQNCATEGMSRTLNFELLLCRVVCEVEEMCVKSVLKTYFVFFSCYSCSSIVCIWYFLFFVVAPIIWWRLKDVHWFHVLKLAVLPASCSQYRVATVTLCSNKKLHYCHVIKCWTFYLLWKIVSNISNAVHIFTLQQTFSHV